MHYENGSFSAVSKPQIARVGAFFSIFQDLQDYNTSAPLRSQNLSNKVVTIFQFSNIFKENVAFFELFSANFAIFARKFHENLAELRENPRKCGKSTRFAEFSLKYCDQFLKFLKFAMKLRPFS